MDIAEEMDGLYSESTDPWKYLRINRFPILYGLVEQFSNKGRMLEVGCGEGILSEGIPDMLKDNYVGIDVSEVAVSRARVRHYDKKGMSWIVGDISTYDFDCKFSTIVVSDVYPYLNDVLSVHSKIVGLLLKGGVLIATSSCSSYCGSEMFPGLEFQDVMKILFTGRSLTSSMKKNYESEYYVGKKR